LTGTFRLIDDWNRSNPLQEDRLNPVTFVHLLEMRRIELSLESGTDPEPLANRPVAFGIFRALNKRGESCYLFEQNKDWGGLNFVGGKQESEDQSDFHRTLNARSERRQGSRRTASPCPGSTISRSWVTA
jgi:hypothetical protein